MSRLPHIATLAQTTRRLHNSVTANLASFGVAIARAQGQTPQTAYWRRKERNFGDLLTPVLLSHFGIRPVYAPPTSAAIVAAGSVLGSIRADYEGVILGTGFMSGRMKRSYPAARILALRGELTRSRANASPNVLLADPGLLVSELVDRPRDPRFVVGLVPHYTDRNDPRLRRLASSHRKSITVIDVRADPTDVLGAISSCRYILSSSLHGLISADAFGLPRAWIRLSDNVVGGGFKFADYASSLGEDLKFRAISGSETLGDLKTMTRTADPRIIRDKQESLKAHFEALVEMTALP